MHVQQCMLWGEAAQARNAQVSCGHWVSRRHKGLRTCRLLHHCKEVREQAQQVWLRLGRVPEGYEPEL
jgi:hypothetical protein